MDNSLKVLVKDFRSNAAMTLDGKAKGFSAKVDSKGLVVADMASASFYVAPCVINAASNGSQMLLLGYFQSKKGHFKSGYYLIRVDLSQGRPSEEAEWMDETGAVKRRTKIWWVDQKPKGEANKITIDSVDEKPLPNGTVCIFIDGTFSYHTHEFHFFFYLF